MGKDTVNFYLVPMHDMSLEDVFTYYNENRFEHEQNFDPGDLDFSLQSQRIRLLRSIIEADRKIAYRLSVITSTRRMIGVVKISAIGDEHQKLCDVSFSVDRSLNTDLYSPKILNRATNLAFKEYGFRKAWLTLLDTNVTRHKHAEEIGYVRVGLLRQNEKIRGVWRDFVLFEKINPDADKED